MHGDADGGDAAVGGLDPSWSLVYLMVMEKLLEKKKSAAEIAGGTKGMVLTSIGTGLPRTMAWMRVPGSA